MTATHAAEPYVLAIPVADIFAASSGSHTDRGDLTQERRT
jgi:hypothetical protein